MKKLIRGIVEFRKNLRPAYRETFARLALGQSPDSLFIACSDSRVVPNLFASTEPGDLFVIRNVGNLIAPCGAGGLSVADEAEAAAIEFSTALLGVTDIIVCGHSECGAMRALLDPGTRDDLPHLRAWLRHAAPALERLRAGERMAGELSLHDHLSQMNVLQQLAHLETYDLVRDRIASGSLRLHAWWFDIASANVLTYAPARHAFAVLDETEATRLLAELDRGA